MKVKVAINGFGRIGRMVFRKAMLDEQIDIAVINASYPPETLAHLIKYDTNHGRYELDVKAGEDCLFVNGKKVMLTNQRDPKLLPWAQYGIDIAVEATGKFNSKEKAEAHIEAGAKKVILTAPGRGTPTMMWQALRKNINYTSFQQMKRSTEKERNRRFRMRRSLPTI